MKTNIIDLASYRAAKQRAERTPEALREELASVSDGLFDEFDREVNSHTASGFPRLPYIGPFADESEFTREELVDLRKLFMEE